MARHEAFGRNAAVSCIAHLADNGPEKQHLSVSCSLNHCRDAAVRHNQASRRNTRESYLLASFISLTAAMLFFSCSKAESTPAVTFSALCTMRLCLIKLANSRSSSLPVPLEWYNSFRVVSEALWSVRVLSPYLSCWMFCQPWSLSAFLDRQRSQPSRQLRSCGGERATYRCASKEDLRRFPAPQAFEELVDDILRHVDLHCLDGRCFGDPRADVAVRGACEGNASRGKQEGSHGEAVGESADEDATESGTGCMLAPLVGQGERCIERAPRRSSKHSAKGDNTATNKRRAVAVTGAPFGVCDVRRAEKRTKGSQVGGRSDQVRLS